MTRPVVFISHIQENAAIAKALKVFLEEVLLEGIEVFVSSDGSIPAGCDFQQPIVSKLKATDVALVVCTNASISRPWINFEAGGALVRGARVIPLCWHGAQKGKLPAPLGHLHALDLGDTGNVEQLVREIAAYANLKPRRINVNRLKRLLPKRINETYDITPSMLLGVDAAPDATTRIAKEYTVIRRPTMLKLHHSLCVGIEGSGEATFKIRETVLHLERLASDTVSVYLHCRSDQAFDELDFNPEGARMVSWNRVNDTVVQVLIAPDTRVRVLVPFTYAYSWKPPMVWGPDVDVISIPIEKPTGLHEVSVVSKLSMAKVVAFKDDAIRKTDKEIAEAALNVTNYNCPPANFRPPSEFTWSMEAPPAQSVYRLVIFYANGRYGKRSTAFKRPTK